GWDYDWALFPTPAAAIAWQLEVPEAGRYEVSVLHTAKTIGGEVRVHIGDNDVRTAITTVYDPPEIHRPDLVPRWEVPDKIFRPLPLGQLPIPAGIHPLEVTAAKGIEIQAVRLKRLP
ncbi:MAG: hypothetical protein ACK53L_22350, partial [Pirellulaceae bacterium]